GKSRAPKVLRLGRWKPLALVLAFGYIAVAFVLPLVVLIWASTQPYLGGLTLESLQNTTLAAYESIFGDGLFRRALSNTLLLGVAAAVIAMTISTAVSWIIVRVKSRFTPLVDLLAFMPHAFPGVVIGLATLFVYLLLPLPVYGTIWI